AVVGTTELFDDTLRLCCLELRCRAARTEPRRVTRDRPPRSALDRATLAAEETSGLDLELYRLADELLSARLAEAGG
ncbi:MAG TPA: hypothetical protein VE528_05565, partial [Thermoleophilaceae bacterium]|nr:hypothetical protein [Thermoleophilaceae bacterium]